MILSHSRSPKRIHPQISQITQIKDKNELNSFWFYLCNLRNLRMNPLQQANTLRSFDSADRICVLTVPIGRFDISAICS